MPGPLPKDPAIRQRRNKASTRAVVAASPAALVEYPALPEKGAAWHPLAVRWWDDIWSSPHHQEFLRADTGALFRLANLVDDYWKTGALKYAAEIRLLEREFGLTPLARRRLEWTVVQTEEAATKRERKPARSRVVDADVRGTLEE